LAEAANHSTEPEAGKQSAWRVDWADPSIPAGDSPPMPRWPLVVGGAIWCAWVAFLTVMVIIRLRTTAV
jgi:hypothetical protein